MKIYQVDAFAKTLFQGNPAAVVPLEKWLPDTLMQQIAMENNRAETAFLVKEGEDFHIRWFTPSTEVDLCGHATLASAFVLHQYEGYTGDTIRFHSRSGLLTVTRNGDLLSLCFPPVMPDLTTDRTDPPPPASLTIGKAQELVDQWIRTTGVRYFSELTNMAILTEEVGEVARLMSRLYGDQSFKETDKGRDLADELADVLWVLICIANQTGVGLTAALLNNIAKKNARDSTRHQTNAKLS
jgi:NTP pyrophosphatase (non-canonical NTP hydrolase)